MVSRILYIATILLVPASAAAEPCAPEDPREACQDVEISMMPGGFGAVFVPNGHAGSPFVGGGGHVSLRLWSTTNDRLAPSQGSLFLQAALLKSNTEAHALALFEAGGTFTFERNPARRFLLPYFGGVVGWLEQQRLGSSAYLEPLAGVHLYWHPNFMLAVTAGYLFPFRNLDALRGVRADLTLRFSLW